MMYFWNQIALFDQSAGLARACVYGSIDHDLSGEVPSATRRYMQPYCVKYLLYILYVEWVGELMSEWNGEWMGEWMLWWKWCDEWMAWWLNEFCDEWMNSVMNE